MRTFFFCFLCTHAHIRPTTHPTRRRASDLSRARVRIPSARACFRVLGGSRFAHSHAGRVVLGTFLRVPGYSKFTEKTAPDTSSWLKWVYYYIFIYNGEWVCTWGAPMACRAVYQFVCPGAELLETSVRMSYRAPGVVVCGVFWGSAAHRSQR